MARPRPRRLSRQTRQQFRDEQPEPEQTKAPAKKSSKKAASSNDSGS